MLEIWLKNLMSETYFKKVRKLHIVTNVIGTINSPF